MKVTEIAFTGYSVTDSKREVDDFEEPVKRLKHGGATFLIEPMESRICHLAILSDPEDNSIWIHKRKLQ